MCMDCFHVQQVSRSQHWTCGRQVFYSSGVGGLHKGDLAGKIRGVTGAEHKHNNLVINVKKQRQGCKVVIDYNNILKQRQVCNVVITTF